ncbi:MAG: RlmE family RNA methyltransferase [Bacteroidetes bacterium]|nr:RlmE family RNA methyltransferase [Bacteroidota bacterium]
MSYKPNDYYAQKAKKENFAARSIYKLEEIDKKYRLFKSGYNVLDLGASPGSWMQYAAAKTGDGGKVFGIDLKPVEVKLKNVFTVQGDINEFDLKLLFDKYQFSSQFDIVMSDMAPNTSSNRFTDQARSFDLSMMALHTAHRFIRTGGHFICKIFDGEDAMTFRDEVKKFFVEVHIVRPKSTRDSSKEIFIVGKSYKP